MRHNRLILLTAAAAVLFLSCTGSFGVIVPDFEQYAELPSGGTEIRAAHSFTPRDQAAFRNLTDEFNSTNEYGIRVVLDEPAEKSIEPDCRNDDLVFCTPSQAAALLRDGRSRELSPLIAHPQWGLESGRRRFYPAARRQTDYFDFALRITSVPLLVNTNVVLVNKGLLREEGIDDFPVTWVGFERVLSRAGRKGKPFIGMNMDADTLVSVIMARGGSILRPAGFAYSLFNPVINRTLRLLRELEERGVMVAGRTEYLNQTMFAFGRLPAVYSTLDSIGYYAALAETASPDLDWGSALIPSRKPGKTAVINSVHSAAIVRGEPDKELASWLFIRWLADAEQQTRLAVETGLMPAVREASEVLLLTGADGAAPQWLEALELADGSAMEYIPSLYDYTEVSGHIDDSLIRIHEGHWIWLEAMKLERLVKKNRREENKIRAGKR